jgi:hypothetical protein
MAWYIGNITVTVEFEVDDEHAAENHLNNIGNDIVDSYRDYGTTESSIHDYSEFENE